MIDLLGDVTARALTVKQPFAQWIVDGIKPVENRIWYTHYRGPLFIHAGARWDAEPLESIEQRYGVRIARNAPTRGIIGIVDLVDCVEAHPSRFFTGPYGFVLKNPRPLPFHAMNGQQGFFKPPRDVVDALLRAS